MLKEWKESHIFLQILMYNIQRNSFFPSKPNIYFFIRILGEKLFYFILWILYDAFELDANVANLDIMGKLEYKDG